MVRGSDSGRGDSGREWWWEAVTEGGSDGERDLRRWGILELACDSPFARPAYLRSENKYTLHQTWAMN